MIELSAGELNFAFGNFHVPKKLETGIVAAGSSSCLPLTAATGTILAEIYGTFYMLALIAPFNFLLPGIVIRIV